MYRQDASEDRSVLVIGLHGRVMAFDAHSGVQRWEHTVGHGSGKVELIVHARRVFASTGWELLCLAYPSGRQLSKVTLPTSYNGRVTMLLEGERLNSGSNGEICCFDLEGQLQWHDGLTGKGLGSVSLGFPDNVRSADDVGAR